MRATVLLLLAFGCLVVAAPVGATSPDDGTVCPTVIGNDTDATDSPGKQLADAVGEQESTVKRELADRGFNATLANATGDESRAAVVAAEVERTEHRLDELEGCRANITAARNAGRLNERAYRERVSAVAPKVATVSDRLNRTARVAETLPEALREEYDINATELGMLETRVESLRTFVNETVDRGTDRRPDPTGGPWANVTVGQRR